MCVCVCVYVCVWHIFWLGLIAVQERNAMLYNIFW